MWPMGDGPQLMPEAVTTKETMSPNKVQKASKKAKHDGTMEGVGGWASAPVNLCPLNTLLRTPGLQLAGAKPCPWDLGTWGPWGFPKILGTLFLGSL